MKLTLDRLCITSRRMCPSCQKKLDQGIVDQVDIEIGNVLLNVAKSQRFLSNITVTDIIDTKNTTYIVVGQDDLEKVNRADEYLNDQLKQYKDKDYVFLEKTKNSKKLMESLLAPVVPVGTSTVMLPPDGEKELKVKVKKDDKSRLLSSMELSQVTRAILGMYAHYSYV